MDPQHRQRAVGARAKRDAHEREHARLRGRQRRLGDAELPRLLGGNLKRAIERLEQGQRIAPHNLELWLALGQAYQEAGRKDDARRQFQEVLNRQINPAFPRAGRNAQDKARRLLAKL